MKLMSHLVAGYPTIADSEKLAITMSQTGMDILEIQIPFSDPIADGPIIAKANKQALKQGVCVMDCFKMIKRLTKKISTPIVIMTYYNIAFHFGVDQFCKMMRKVGCYGLIIPDYPFDEESDNYLIKSCKKYNLKFVPIIAPTTRFNRLSNILKQGTGFVYAIARTGTTGKKTIINKKTIHYLNKVHQLSNLPVAVGFGLSDKKQIKNLRSYADIVVIGSAIIKKYNNTGLKGVKQLLDNLKTN